MLVAVTLVGVGAVTEQGPQWSSTTVSHNSRGKIKIVAEQGLCKAHETYIWWKQVRKQGEQGKMGQQGEQGPMGKQGEQGKMGQQGEQGKVGKQGEQGKMGPQREQGKMGKQGEQGPMGQQGEQG